MPGLVSNSMPKAGEVIVAMDIYVARLFPEGTILEAESSQVATIIYKVADNGWTATGFSVSLTNKELAEFTTATRDLQWMVVRVGTYDDNQEK